MIFVNKRPVPPASLAVEKAKANGSYREKDVVDALVEDSFNKCYLCEDSLITSINVEHFHEHRGNVDKKFDWNNLHYACGHCNHTKNDTFPQRDSNLLNCADSRCKVDLWIIYRIEEDPDLKTHAVIIKNLESDVSPFQAETDNTVMLLDRIYNGTGTAIRNQEAYNLLKRVQREVVTFKEELFKYLMETDDAKKEIRFKKLNDALASDKPFLAFKRWIIHDCSLSEQFHIA